MNYSELEKEELLRQVFEEKEKLARLRFNLSLKKVKNTAEIRQTKKNIARALTAFKEKHA